MEQPHLSEEDIDHELELLQQAVDAHPDDSSHHLNLGRHLWERRKGGEWREKAAEHFLISAKLNPQNGEAFRYLGDYYTLTDSQRALKCYQRAVSLLPDNSAAGEALCNLLDKEGKESLEISVCKEALAKSPRAFWASSRIGLLLVHQKKWSEAVPSLQHAIRGYPTSADLWEALGLAYQRLGMYTAAIKSYGRAMELETSRVIAMIESGNIYLMLGSYRKGVEEFQHALEICPQSIAAQYGLASGLLALSKELINQGAFAWAASLLKEASIVSESSAIIAGNISCLWKLHADIQLLYAKSFPWTGGIYQESEQSFARSLLSWQEIRHLATVSAESSYQRALHLAPWQANIYMDVAVAVDYKSTLQFGREDDHNSWQLAQRMSIGSLSLESDNYEFWMALGCLSAHKSLQQHAFIRALQLDVSLATAWSYLGKVYREEAEIQLARQAFDRARSIDPSLALPWAGMSSDILTWESASDEAYDSCLRAVQIMPLAEFQIGLANLALLSGHILSSEVFGAIRQAVQCAPQYPECHNLNGLVSEARSDYHFAAASFGLARYALKTSMVACPPSYYVDVSVNLARALCKAGNVQEAVKELDDLKGAGFLSVEGLQIYAISLWKLGKNDLALAAVGDLALCLPSVKQSAAAAPICLICALLYCISGVEMAINSFLSMPNELFQNVKVSFMLSAVDAIHQSNQLQPFLSLSRRSILSQEDIIEMHLLIALTKLVRNRSVQSLHLRNGIDHLRKALHMYPNSSTIRNTLGYFLQSCKHWDNSHLARRSCALTPLSSLLKDGWGSAQEIIGSEAGSCHGLVDCKLLYRIPTCKYQSRQEVSSLKLMQRWYHQEPWNHNAKYLLVLNILQRARQARFLQHINVLQRMTSATLSSSLSLEENTLSKYKRFQLLLCSSELKLLGRDSLNCVSHAKEASKLSLPDSYIFFAHLQLCRAHAAEDNWSSVNEEFIQCLKLRTNCPIGWTCLKYIESCCKPENVDSDVGFRDSMEDKEVCNSWMAVYNLSCGLVSWWAGDYQLAEACFAEACSLEVSDCCFFLCHGAACMELAKILSDSQYLTLGMKSLRKAMELSSLSLPFVSVLLGQAEGSIGLKNEWEKGLRREWSLWSSETRPAELYFQMHLLAKQASEVSSRPGDYQVAQSLVARAVHLNPSCLRYWRILWKLAE